MWSTRLRYLGWSLRAAKQSAYSIANSSIQTYNMYANRYIQFCKVREVDTDELSLKDLRRKTVTLLALVFIARPSDLAPKGVVFNSKFLSVEKTVLSTNDIQFNDDGSLSVTFWGIKSDSKRQGFEVTVHPNKNDVLSDPVECLRLYVERPQEFMPKDTNPLFSTLKQPYHALSSDTIGNILEEAISAAGLSSLGYSAKSFRPTAATMAVQKGMLPETAMQLGRWKTKEVFFNHYHIK